MNMPHHTHNRLRMLQERSLCNARGVGSKELGQHLTDPSTSSCMPSPLVIYEAGKKKGRTKKGRKKNPTTCT